MVRTVCRVGLYSHTGCWRVVTSVSLPAGVATVIAGYPFTYGFVLVRNSDDGKRDELKRLPIAHDIAKKK